MATPLPLNPNLSNPYKNLVGGLLNIKNQANQSMGVNVKSPQSNIKPQNNVVAPNQIDNSKKTVSAPNISESTIKSEPISTTDTISNQPLNSTGSYTPPNQGTAGVSQGGIIGNLVGIGQNESPEVTAARKDLQDLQESYAKQLAGMKGTPGVLSRSLGQQGVLNSLYTGQLDAKQTALQNALASQGQQITATNSAGQLNAPVTVPYSTQYVSPSSGMPVGGSSQNTNDMVNYWAQQIATGKAGINDVPSVITSAPQLATQLQQSIKSINPNYNPSVQGSQQKSAADLTSQSSQVQAVLNSADASFTLLNNIAKQGGVNSMNVPILNTLQQNVARGLASSDAVTGFQSLLSGIRDQYATILGGGTATDQTRGQAMTQIPDDISLSALQNIQKLLKAEGTNRISGYKEQIKNLTGNTNGQSTNSANPWH